MLDPCPMSGSRTHRWLAWGYGSAIVFPFLYLAFLSLASEWRYPDLWPHYLGLRNWESVLSGQTGLLDSLVISIGISLTVASLSTATGYSISKVVAYHPLRDRWALLTYFPYILSPVVFGACLRYFFLRGHLSGTVIGVIIAQFIIAFPYALIFFRPLWGPRMAHYQDLVHTLGGTTWHSFVKVLLPLSKNMLMICFFQTFLISWFDYGISSIIGVGKVQTLTVKVFLFIKESNYYYGAMSCCLLMAPPVLLIYINKRFVFNKLL